MLGTNFTSLKKIEGVKSIGSDRNEDPYHDPDLTIFFHNGYRLISTKSFFGQSISLEPFFNRSTCSIRFSSKIYHPLPQLVSMSSSPENEYSRVDTSSYTQTKFSQNEFVENILPIVGEEILNFLAERHQTVGFKVSLSQPTKKLEL